MLDDGSKRQMDKSLQMSFPWESKDAPVQKGNVLLIWRRISTNNAAFRLQVMIKSEIVQVSLVSSSTKFSSSRLPRRNSSGNGNAQKRQLRLRWTVCSASHERETTLPAVCFQICPSEAALHGRATTEDDGDVTVVLVEPL